MGEANTHSVSRLTLKTATVLTFKRCSPSAHLHWDVVVHGSGQVDRGGVVGERADHVEVPGHGVHEIQSQVAEGHQGVAKETETLPSQDESVLVFLPLLWSDTDHGSCI